MSKRLVTAFFIVVISNYAQALSDTTTYSLAGGRTIKLPVDTRIVEKDDGGDFVLYDIFNAM